MKKLFLIILLVFISKMNAQNYSGEVFLRDNSVLYLNQVYVTNLTTLKTVLTTYSGEFNLKAEPGDIIRFTSIITERKDVKLTPQMLTTKNLVELKVAYYDIQEVIISRFRPTGNLRYDMNSIRKEDKALALKKVIGLPEPKGDGTSPVLPVAGLRDGGLTFSLESIFDILSGDRKKKQRLVAYERMNNSVTNIKNYLGTDYFTRLKIPENLIDNFLQFVYTSENIDVYVQTGNFEAIKLPIEKYLPIYQRRLKNSHLQDIVK
ncbi:MULTISPECIES: hypothetical protein [Chryseobacterium]|uniref:DUF4369 domain-containing protein n=1 Tax=Chryseobacterium balustinum TaxID=246 RepID=A0AAX2IG60_9FLAO|nr:MULTISPECIES: hypothetical protein [Chryseobacterium]AZB31699.1 hypothetical protein EB354_21935 [Chryseobacterium balustinum]MDY0932150.1 hypothetical protein [Chryseobacterium sp. CFBP8996]SKB84481.1 hypothetical protein SAMN05421800_11093 [Chryseobacterium balustinum]SQA86934.1 Uncharacterised protein [Chryseobacterium balustinum]